MLQKSQIRYGTRKHPELIGRCGSGPAQQRGVSRIAASCFPGCAENSVRVDFAYAHGVAHRGH